MSLETSVTRVIPNALVDASGGSIVVLGIIILIGIAVLLRKLNVGVTSGVMIATFIVGTLANFSDQNYFGNSFLGQKFYVFNVFYLLIIIGMAIYFAVWLRRRN